MMVSTFTYTSSSSPLTLSSVLCCKLDTAGGGGGSELERLGRASGLFIALKLNVPSPELLKSVTGGLSCSLWTVIKCKDEIIVLHSYFFIFYLLYLV